MTARQKTRIPSLGSTADLAGRYFYKNGPATEAELCLAVKFGLEQERVEIDLQRAITGGWLRPLPGGALDCSAAAKAYYDEEAGVVTEPEDKPIGQIAATRQQANVFERPPLSRKHMPNSRGLRQDVPEWSRRPAGFCFKGIGGTEV